MNSFLQGLIIRLYVPYYFYKRFFYSLPINKNSTDIEIIKSLNQGMPKKYSYFEHLYFHKVLYSIILSILNVVYNSDKVLSTKEREALNQLFIHLKRIYDYNYYLHLPLLTPYDTYNEFYSLNADYNKTKCIIIRKSVELIETKAKIERLFIESGSQVFSLPPAIQAIVNETNSTISNLRDYKLINGKYKIGNLVVDQDNALLQYKSEVINITPTNNEILFLVYLIANKDKALRYHEIAKDLNLNSYNPHETDMSRIDISGVKKLKSNTMKFLKQNLPNYDENLDELVISVRGIGYKIVSP